MIKFDEQLRKFEDFLTLNGVHSFCYQVSPGEFNEEEKEKEESSGPFIQMVIYSDSVIPQMARILTQNKPLINRQFGPDHKMAPQFIMYFMSYLNFGAYTKDLSNIFLSNSFLNIRVPRYEEINGFNAQIFRLKITAIIEGPADKDFIDIRDDVERILDEFNWNSRYIKIESFDFGTTNSRGQIGPHEINYEQNILELNNE